MDEEDELAEVKPDAVPSEVREWLTSTFTRNQVSSRNRTDDKPKFRSVANAIRAGIMVDRYMFLFLFFVSVTNHLTNHYLFS